MRFLFAFPLALLAACGGEAFTAGARDAAAGGAAGTSGATGTGAATGTGGGGGTGGATGTGGAAGTQDAAGDAPIVTGAGGSAGAARNSGDCETKDDCGGDPCVELIVGGYRVCVSPVAEATTCSIPAGQCCKSADCSATAAGSKCVLGPAQPSCGPAVLPSNVCVSDGCKNASDCTGDNAICQPAGVFGSKAARCVTGGCRFDRDCLGQGASCAPVVDSCCNALVGLYCVYPNGCRRDGDCGAGQHCAIQGNRTTCVAGAVACPASL